MRVMDDEVVRQFVAELVEELPGTQPAAVVGLSRAALAERCLAAVRRGRACGLSHRADLHGFVVVSLLLGDDFHERPGIAAVLSGTAVADGRKMLVVTTAILRVRLGAAAVSGGGLP